MGAAVRWPYEGRAGGHAGERRREPSRPGLGEGTREDNLLRLPKKAVINREKGRDQERGRLDWKVGSGWGAAKVQRLRGKAPEINCGGKEKGRLGGGRNGKRRRREAFLMI